LNPYRRRKEIRSGGSSAERNGGYRQVDRPTAAPGDLDTPQAPAVPAAA